MNPMLGNYYVQAGRRHDGERVLVVSVLRREWNKQHEARR